MAIEYCDTSDLRIAYAVGGPEVSPPLLLLHGWPDDATTFDQVAPALQEKGWRTIVPWLRGFGPTRFLSDSTMRSGEVAAMAQDMVEFVDALGLSRFAVVGHDWGARIAYFLTSVFPDRITNCAALSVGWKPGQLSIPSFDQGKAFWYQWFMATERGAEVVRNHGKALARFMWDSWSPPGWFDDRTFDSVARSFDNPDWAEVTLHSYRVRWGETEPDPKHSELARRQRSARTISVPTMMVQGGEDRCVLPSSTKGMESYFSGPYARRVIEGVGHFPSREAPDSVVELLLEFLTPQ